jgi:D-alanyl-lipoteichoic acid acyltransferase DltB (MBOAT superfamily)
MSYLSPEFAVCFLLFLLLYWALARWSSAQKVALLLASYAVYASLDWRFSATLACYTASLLLLLAAAKRWSQHRKNWLLRVLPRQ